MKPNSWFWLAYWVCGLCLLVYTGLGFIASTGASGTLVLASGQSDQGTVFRLSDGMLHLTLAFPRDDVGKPKDSAEAHQRKKLATTPLAINVSINKKDFREYFAYRESGYSFNPPRFYRRFWAKIPENLDSWYPSNFDQELPLHQGKNHIVLTVKTIDPAFEGIQVVWTISPALGLKSTEPGVDWLVWSLFWFVYWPFYAFVGIFLALSGRWALRRKLGSKQ